MNFKFLLLIEEIQIQSPNYMIPFTRTFGKGEILSRNRDHLFPRVGEKACLYRGK
jgi:hypothetical protein